MHDRHIMYMTERLKQTRAWIETQYFRICDGGIAARAGVAALANEEACSTNTHQLCGAIRNLIDQVAHAVALV